MSKFMDSVSTPTEEFQNAPATAFTALVKGAGPAGLASAAALARHGFNVTVVERRQRRAAGDGRKNVVAIRPEALRNLDHLGALEYLVARGALTDMTAGATMNQWDGSVFDWVPLFRRYYIAQDDQESGYEIPGKIIDQIPSSFVHLGDLEDALLEVCERNKVNVMHGMTVRLELSNSVDNTNTKYTAHLATTTPGDANLNTHDVRGSATTPDLIVCASGKNDSDLALELGFRRHIGVRLDETCLTPSDSNSSSGSSDAGSDSSSSTTPSDPRTLHLGEDGEIESQFYSVFAVRHPEQAQSKPELMNGAITHVVRKDGTGIPPQPLTEITMGHKDVAHLIIHLPRNLKSNSDDQEALEKYVVDRVNTKLGTDFTSVKDMRLRDAIIVGDPLVPVLVETTTAPKYVFGSNVVLVGDAAMSCSPASGVGADIGMTIDSKNIGLLGEDFIRSVGKGKERSAYWEQALDRFNRRKAEAAIIWSQASRMFYITGQEANDILQQIEHSNENSSNKLATN